jgi:hypothetical protein
MFYSAYQTRPILSYWSFLPQLTTALWSHIVLAAQHSVGVLRVMVSYTAPRRTGGSLQESPGPERNDFREKLHRQVVSTLAKRNTLAETRSRLARAQLALRMRGSVAKEST